MVVIVVFLLISCNKDQGETLIKSQGNIFGTYYNIIYDNDKNYQKSIDSLFGVINQVFSTYKDDSVISRVNRRDTTVVVDRMFEEAFEKAKRIYKETEGYFDPTIGKLINAYGFGSGKEKKNLSDVEVERLMKDVGFDKVTLKNGKVFIASETIEFNLNAFAKGFGIDIIGRFFESKNIKNYLVEIGGEIRARGRKKGSPWKVAIEKPNVDGTRSFHKIIELTDESMATSGNYRKYKINEKGNKIVHTVNPKTGLAQESNLLSVSVRMQGDCADVDAYATAFLAMGFEKTTEFLKEHPKLKVVLLYSEKGQEIKEFSN